MLRRLEPYLFLLPALLCGLIFVALPTIGVFVLSLYQWDFMSPPRFVGLTNWAEGIRNPGVIQSVRSTLWIVSLVVPTSIAIGLGLALLVNSIDLLKTQFRTILFAPFVASLVAVSFIWRDLFATHNGLFNYFLGQLGLPQIPWLSDQTWAPISVSLVAIWHQSGYCMLIYLARLQGINTELIDAAKVDGATPWQRFTNVIVPQVSPATFFLVVIGLISGLQIFEAVFVITGGGPGYATTTMVYFIFRETFQNFDVGSAGVMSVLLLTLIATVTLALWGAQRWIVSYDS